MLRRAERILILLLVFIAPGTSLAEPISTSGLLTIASGSLGFRHDTDDPFAQGELFGDGFSWTVFLERTSRGTFASPPRFDPSFGNAALVIAGNLQIGAGNLEFQFDRPFSADFVVTAEPQTVPPATSDPFFNVAYPFQLSGVLFGEGADGRSYRYELVGSGTGTTVYLTGIDKPRFTSLGFEPAAPVPEPATLLLLGLGVSGIAVRSRRRSGQSKA